MTDEKRKEIVESMCGNCWEYWDFTTGVRTQKLYPLLAIEFACPANNEGNELHVEFLGGTSQNFIIDRPPNEFAALLFRAKIQMYDIAKEMGVLEQVAGICVYYLKHGDEMVEQQIKARARA